MIKSVLINDEATVVVSASGDGTIKTWDLRQQRCFHTYHMHKDSVWTLTFDSTRGQDYVVSGGRDRNVFYVDMKKNEVCHLLRADKPVTSVRKCCKYHLSSIYHDGQESKGGLEKKNTLIPYRIQPLP